MNFKSFAAGLIAGAAFIGTASGTGGIKSAAFNYNKIIYEGAELDLTGRQLISVVKEGEIDPVNYIPVSLFSSMGYDVEWDGAEGAIIINVTPPALASAPQSGPSTPADPNDPLARQVADAKQNMTTSFKEGETFTYYKNGLPLYSLTLKKAPEEKYFETQIVDKNGQRALQVIFEYENFGYNKELTFSTYKFTGIGPDSYTIAPVTTLNGYTRAMYNAELTNKHETFKGYSGNKCPQGTKSMGKLIIPVGGVKSLQIRCQYQTYEGMENGVTWDFTVN